MSLKQPWKSPVVSQIVWDGYRNGQSTRLLLVEGCKRCPRCKQIKLLSDFTMRGDSKYAVSWCKDCHREYYTENIDSIRELRREQRIGVPVGTYDYLVSTRGAKCEICGADKADGTGTENNQFCIDHDHETDLIRGLLCTQCNVGIGMLKHNIEYLKSAISFLQKPGISLEELRNLLSNSPKSAEELGL